ncbi:MAG: nitric oxide reductase transcriptional regulator NorR [Polaromonas sp.]|nr:nitric oxide reductase transcriptional regulator NorR [Polaromonas sp.]
MTTARPNTVAGHRLLAFVPLVNSLAQDMTDAERYRRLLQTVRALLPCHAVALLRLEGSLLLPVAVDGLSPDTLGRRFKTEEHPRFAALLAAEGPVRFPSDSALPDPYDGLVEGPETSLKVHDCVGCVVQIGGQPWGILTIDSLEEDSFSRIELADLQAFASLAAATVSVADHIRGLTSRVEAERLRADAWRSLAKNRYEPRLLGQSVAHKHLLQEIESVARSDLTVLITGETGVGKELVAHAIHAASSRAGKAFVSLNCAALPENLVESELFGHVRGAFSGAVSERRGKFELADGATLFLDEIGELSLTVQAKLLRVLQNGQLQRLGSDKDHHVDVRLIAATNRNLTAEVQAGRLREDFYHRLSVYPLLVPPLRERAQDVLLLAGTFLEENKSRLGLGGLRLDAGAKMALLAHSWPGNVRELEHLIGRSALKATAAFKTTRPAAPLRHSLVSISSAHFDLPRDEQSADTPTQTSTWQEIQSNIPLRDAVDHFQRQRIEDTLRFNKGNLASTARDLGLHRANLARLVRRLGMSNRGD